MMAISKARVRRRPAKKAKTCSRGHKFYKSSDCPVCPICWSGYYREKNGGDFPDQLAAPALRALLNAKIYNLAELTKRAEREILELHGMGPNAVRRLKVAMRNKGLSFTK